MTSALVRSCVTLRKCNAGNCDSDNGGIVEVRFVNSIHQIDRQQWNLLCGDNYPFCRYEFLAALEDAGCTTLAAGWQVTHLAVYEQQQLIAVMPGYIKEHSYGEYVFDWAWADAYRRYGFNYYPKWINAIPFTPCAGPRLLVREEHNRPELMAAIMSALQGACELQGYSGWHCLFPNHAQHELFISPLMMQRLGCQFHWFNAEYQHFDDFLACMASRKRKNIIKERRQVGEQGFEFIVKEGGQLQRADMELFYALYRNTYLKRSGHGGYLSQAFFQQLVTCFAEYMVLVCAAKKDENGEQSIVAAALFFRDQQTLYGRYWGCFEEYQFLHFETCYYQGIDYAIANGLQRFDGGAQGEHKIARGFEPVITYSSHYLQAEEFRPAIARFLREEAEHIQHYANEARELLPFKQE